ncbi:DUF2207 domain-containing protein [Arsenicicoccus dermatophilus]|uniref:DUF2207 domain-containing protein n=1 Tax=Arsenicicoccus dermatophilus TaxID=1076331 RepID=UPI003891908B
MSLTTTARPGGTGRLPAALAATVVSLWLLLMGAVPASAVTASAIAARAEGTDRVLHLAVDYRVDAQGGVDVTESYQYQFNDQGRHGFTRYVPTVEGYDPKGGSADSTEHRVYEIRDIKVTSPDAPADASVSTLGNNTVIRVGSASQTVSGTKHYVISYHLDHVVNEQKAGVEFYPNVLGSQWQRPIDQVDVTVTGPAAPLKVGCTYGPVGTKKVCATATNGTPARFSATGLAPRDAMTVGAMFPRSAFTDVSKQIEQGGPETSDGRVAMSPSEAKARTLGQLGVGLGAPLLAALGMGALVWRRGRDERYVGLAPDTLPAPGQQVETTRGGKALPVAVRFTPPDDATPGLIGTIYDESADTIDVSATVIDLAVRGYLRIEQTQDGGVFQTNDWKLEYLGTPKPGDRGLLRYERTILDGIFTYGTPVMMSELKNRFAPTLAAAKQEMYAETVQRGWFRSSPEQVRNAFGCLTWLPFLLLGGWFFFGSGSFVGALESDQIAGIELPVPSLLLAGAGLFAVPFIVRALAKRMPARTADGSAVLYQARGFREYLLTAEAEQITFDEALDIFSRYLPYAVVFGVADRWAKVFAQVAEMAQAQGYDVGMPTFYVWYGGGFGDFSDFGNAVDSFSTTAAGAFTSTPGSSGGSGFGDGGFGDFGGFSGDGFGGGGGDSW